MILLVTCCSDRAVAFSQCKCEKIIHHLIFDLLFHPANGFKHLKELRICISSASINDIFFLLKHCIVERLIMFSHYFVKNEFIFNAVLTEIVFNCSLLNLILGIPLVVAFKQRDSKSSVDCTVTIFIRSLSTSEVYLRKSQIMILLNVHYALYKVKPLFLED